MSILGRATGKTVFVVEVVGDDAFDQPTLRDAVAAARQLACDGWRVRVVKHPVRGPARVVFSAAPQRGR